MQVVVVEHREPTARQAHTSVAEDINTQAATLAPHRIHQKTAFRMQLKMHGLYGLGREQQMAAGEQWSTAIQDSSVVHI
jgi:hypothetical protein